MIAKLRGKVWECSFTRLVLDVHDVGYELQIPISTYDTIVAQEGVVELYVHTQVREDAFTLFGFASEAEKSLFELLIGVSGVGGKLALAILSGLPVNEFCQAVANKNTLILSKISGIGKRTAERLVVELHDKVAAVATSSLADGSRPANIATGGDSSAITDAALALEQLGFKRDTALKALRELTSTIPEAEQTTENLLRLGIQRLNQ